ncbi:MULTISPECIES: hypothetical protein [Alteromonas]|nr:hypothetical protein [Alteromonas sp. KUL150]
MAQPTHVVGSTTSNDKEFTSPLAGYTLHSARRCVCTPMRIL